MTVDPTRIDIQFDPTVQRMRGISKHGLMPFDVPYVSGIVENLWLGGCQAGLILPEFVKHLVSLYPWESYAVTHPISSLLLVTMYDSEDQGFAQVDAMAHWVNVCRADGPTLVHCQAGLNRSALVVARALILDGMPSADAIRLIRAKRSPVCLCNQSFERWLLRQ